jgi:hypothetical protein
MALADRLVQVDSNTCLVPDHEARMTCEATTGNDRTALQAITQMMSFAKTVITLAQALYPPTLFA